MTDTTKRPSPLACIISGCNRPRHRRDLCNTHQMRLYRTGTTAPDGLPRDTYPHCDACGWTGMIATAGRAAFMLTKHRCKRSTLEQTRVAFDVIAKEGSELAAARALGLAQTTFRKLITRDPTLAAALTTAHLIYRDPRCVIARNIIINPAGCWTWTGAINNAGYGRTTDGYAHRLSYDSFIGPIPDGRELDHVCHSNDPTCPGGELCVHRRCVNPWHLEPVTALENVHRAVGRSFGGWRDDECIHGHDLTDEGNLYLYPEGRRQCRPCRRGERAA